MLNLLFQDICNLSHSRAAAGRMKMKKRKSSVPQEVWHNVYSTMFDDVYQKKCRLLDEAGIDYRVFMDPDEANLVYLRNYINKPDSYRMYYAFYVTRRDYKKACEAMKTLPDSPPGGFCSIAM